MRSGSKSIYQLRDHVVFAIQEGHAFLLFRALQQNVIQPLGRAVLGAIAPLIDAKMSTQQQGSLAAHDTMVVDGVILRPAAALVCVCHEAV